MTLARGITLLGAVLLMSFAPARIDNRLLVFGGIAVVIYANWLTLGYSPAMDWQLVVAPTLLQGTGLGILLPALFKRASSTLDPKLRPEGIALFYLSRVYGSVIGIAVVQIFFQYPGHASRTRQDITPYRAPLMSRARSPSRGLPFSTIW